MHDPAIDPHASGLVDERGQPLPTHIQEALRVLRPRFRRSFRVIVDEVTVTTLFELAGRRIAARERDTGQRIERLHEFAWVTLRRLALDYLDLESTRAASTALSDAALVRVVSSNGSPESIERGILFQELLAQLAPQERQLCLWKAAGRTSEEIAQHLGTSVAAVNTAYSRAIQKLRLVVTATRSSNTPGLRDAPSASDKRASRARAAATGRRSKAP
jgi:RNA polymerase sigma factor (sigma-70 family)